MTNQSTRTAFSFLLLFPLNCWRPAKPQKVRIPPHACSKGFVFPGSCERLYEQLQLLHAPNAVSPLPVISSFV